VGNGNPLPFLAAIVASNKATLVRGASVLLAPARPVFDDNYWVPSGKDCAQTDDAISFMTKTKSKVVSLSTLNSKKDANIQGWISQAEAARIRGVSRQLIGRLIKKGRLRVLRIAGKVLLNRREVENYKPQRTGRPRKRSAEVYRIEGWPPTIAIPATEHHVAPN